MYYYDRTGFGSRLFDFLNAATLCLLIAVTLYPFVYVLSLSLSEPMEITAGRVVLWPVRFHLEAYNIIFHVNDIVQAYRNTLVYTLVGTLLTLFFTVTVAYPLSRRDLQGRRVLMMILASSMFMPTSIIAKFLLVKELYLLNTIWAVTLPAAFSIWYVILCRTAFQEIPDELIESASMDGAGVWRILLQIVLPLSKPMLATVFLFSAVDYWNDFLNALLYLTDSNKYPLQMILRRLLSVQDNLEDVNLGRFVNAGPGGMRMVQAAATMVTVGPIILVYPFIQKYFIKGALVGSVKG